MLKAAVRRAGRRISWTWQSFQPPSTARLSYRAAAKTMVCTNDRLCELQGGFKVMYCQPSVQIDTTIELTELESQIFDTLLKARHAKGLATTLRCAGGWVRDKLLKRESRDIDIALDDISGVRFAECVNEYLEQQARFDAGPAQGD